MSSAPQSSDPNKTGSRATALASLAALGSMIAASSCCIPLTPFLFAAGTAGTSAFLTKLRPYFLVTSVLLIAFGFYQSSRAKKCNRKPAMLSTILLWFSAIIVFVFIFFPQAMASWLAGKS